MKRRPELLAPAGDWISLNAAVSAGADSVYFGIKGLNMRHFAGNFDILELKKVMGCLHGHGKKGYLTLNTVVMNEQLSRVKDILSAAGQAGVDAVILWDMAVFMMAKQEGLPIHISTQASVSNVAALGAYAGLGVKRIVLARECTLDDIREIIRLKDEMEVKCEVEAFIHGAMCVSISGRCFLSQYSHGKSANRGQCVQPCRREYLIRDIQEGKEFELGRDYLLSPKDLCTIDFIDELIDSGIDSFKIEGRIRSGDYASVVTSCYREAIDSCIEGTFTQERKAALKEKLASVYNRGFSSGFYFGCPDDSISRALENLYEKIYAGDVVKYYKKIGVAEIALRSEGIKLGDDILFIGKDTLPDIIRVEELEKEHQSVDSAKKGDKVGMKVPFAVKPKDKVFLWRKKVNTRIKDYPPKDGSASGGRNKD